MPDDAAPTDADQNDPAMFNRAAMLIGLVVIAALVAVLAGWTGPDNPTGIFAAVDTLIRAIPITALWLAAAIGCGWPARRLLLSPDSRDGLLLQTALGVAILLWLDSALGAAGLLFIGGSIGAWIIAAVGLILLGWQIKSNIRVSEQASIRPHWLWWTAGPAIAVLLVASTSAPGWLWATEFGGYDALSYHLQLPREWIALGSITPLEHNVYSYLPGSVEAAYTHLALLRSDAHDSAYACQLLHACMAVLTAILAARVTQRIINVERTQPGSIITGVLLLGSPWVIVTGSLAYNELFTALMLAAGMLVLTDDRTIGWRCGIMIGAFAGAACTAKLTSFGFVALPLGAVSIATHFRRRLIITILSGAAAGLVMLAPWLIRNWLACGNPVFPFMTDLLGSTHWSAEQVAAWNSGHFVEGGIGERLGIGFEQFFRFGLGANPDASGFEPWKPQWLILPWLGLIAWVIGMLRESTRRWSILLAVTFVVQVLFWIGFTHIKSRFMLPSVVPLTIMIGIALHVLTQHITRAMIPVTIAALAGLVWCIASVFIYRSEANGWPSLMLGNHRLWTGQGMAPDEQRAHAMTSSPVVLVNHVLPPDARVLLIGDAKPYYYDLDRIMYQTTWDRGPMSQVVREHPEDSAAWIGALRDRGFSHVLIDTAMLERWNAAGWGDPLLDPQRLSETFQSHARIIADYGNVRVYGL